MLQTEVILAQTDTTVGFLSQSQQALRNIKRRSQQKPFLKVYADLKRFKAAGGRIPPIHRVRLRRSKKTTYIVKSNAFRIVRDMHHHRLLQRYGWFFSTSANRSGEPYERSFCEAGADIIIEDFRGLYEAPPSSIERLGRKKRRKMR
jgi:tRNA A37 threonylcarbamoyladenosine synthetase subunit TsaC/SUA5/YrdC